MTDEIWVVRMLRVETPAFAQGFYGKHHLFSGSFDSVSVGKRNWSFSVLNYRNVSIGSNLQCSKLVE